MTRYYHKIVAVFAVLGLLSSCVKDDLKVPTLSEVRFDINRSASPSGHLQFHSGEIRLADFIVDTDRLEGEDMYVNREFASGLLLSLDSNMVSSELDLTLPQGQYSKIEIEFGTFDDLGQNTVVVEGVYVNSMSQSIPIRFEFNSSENFSIVLLNDNQGGAIVLDENYQYSLMVKFDPIYWFDIVPVNMLETATITNFQGENTLLITGSINEDIHDIVVARIDEAMEGNIYKN